MEESGTAYGLGIRLVGLSETLGRLALELEFVSCLKCSGAFFGGGTWLKTNLQVEILIL